MKKVAISFLFLAVSFVGCKKEDHSLDSACNKPAQIPGLFVLPTAFSPNGDGKNDRYRPLYGQIRDDNYELIVQRLNGEIAFQTTSRDSSWGGNNNKEMDNLYEVHVKFTDSANISYNLCTYLFVPKLGKYCIYATEKELSEHFFEDQLDPGSFLVAYPTGEYICQ